MGNSSGKEEPRPEGEVDLRDFKLRQVIGKGAFGKVKLVEHKITKSKYALKYINKLQCIEKKQVYHMFDERMLLESLEHPFIVNLRYAFQDDENMFMVLDVALGGDLRYHLLRLGTFPEDTLKVYAAEVGLALQYLHSQRIMHRDLKPDNLLLDENGHIYVTDFNIAFKIKDKLPSSQSGSMAYMAPEMFTKKPYDVFVDWWALGVVLYECTYGYRDEEKSLIEVISDAHVKFSTGPPEHLARLASVKAKKGKKEKAPFVWNESEGRTSFISGLLVKNVEKRLGSGPNGLETSIMTHPWFQGFDWELARQKKVIPSFVPDPNNANFEATHEIEEVIMNDMKTLQYKPRKKKKGQDATKSNSKKKKNEDPAVVAIEKALDYIDEHFIPYNKELGIGRLDASTLLAAPDKQTIPTSQSAAVLPAVSSSAAGVGASNITPSASNTGIKNLQAEGGEPPANPAPQAVSDAPKPEPEPEPTAAEAMSPSTPSYIVTSAVKPSLPLVADTASIPRTSATLPFDPNSPSVVGVIAESATTPDPPAHTVGPAAQQDASAPAPAENTPSPDQQPKQQQQEQVQVDC
ncbi:kinase-like domain-containing protein [Entophlyctis helioformis]|nr:kinase-like domain-containing protein [Entophlyctis helioformis]